MAWVKLVALLLTAVAAVLVWFCLVVPNELGGLGPGSFVRIPLEALLFVAVVLSLGRMYRDSEMAIWFSAGVGLDRFIRPVLRMAWPVYAGQQVDVFIDNGR